MTPHPHPASPDCVRAAPAPPSSAPPRTAADLLTPAYADIFGVPFSGFPVAGLPE
jgi:hypothetical protein